MPPPLISDTAIPEILVDYREVSSGVPSALWNLGYKVSFRRLQTGDYLLGGQLLVERKTLVVSAG